MQVLINKMGADRDRVYAQIERNKSKSTSDYSWMEAKNDLRAYMVAGTFGSAMDSLVAATGEDAVIAAAQRKQAKINAAACSFTRQSGLKMVPWLASHNMIGMMVMATHDMMLLS